MVHEYYFHIFLLGVLVRVDGLSVSHHREGGNVHRHKIRRNIPRMLHKWPNATVPYAFDKTFDKSLRTLVDGGMKHIERCSCIRFVRWQRQPNHIRFVGGFGCSADVGMLYMKDWQAISLERHCATSIGTVIHELMHVLGFVHEHQRSDRDKFVKIHEKNIKKKDRDQFKVRDDLKTFAPYDVDSIMHYPTDHAAKDKHKPTITQIRNRKHKIGQRDHLSKIDKYELNYLYCQKGRIKNKL